jgi:ATP-dependent HslUV protease ATP-binding subunit HslU
MKTLTPKEIVAELDKHIVGQADAKKAVSIALRNRWRRQQVDEKLREEIVPKNILMIGPTGVGKTEIARRLAKLADAPFIKVEATKFTEVGYVGRDVDSIIRDLIEVAVNQAKQLNREEVAVKASENARDRIVNALVGETSGTETKARFREKLDNNELEDTEIEIAVQDNGSSSTGFSSFDLPNIPGAQMGILNITDIIGKMSGGTKTKPRKLKVSEARKLLLEEETEKLTDMEKIVQNAVKQVEENGIVFLDEIDKIATRSERGGDVSREGVQRDLLPLIEGTVIATKYGSIKTDHVLFIASGAFHIAKPADLLPELQGRLPIRVELNPLTQEDMVRILTEPEASLIKQYIALLGTEKVDVTYNEEAIDEIAKMATDINKNVENIGARRLHTIMEKLMEEISFDAPALGNNPKKAKIKIDRKYVQSRLKDVASKTDVSKFIL